MIPRIVSWARASLLVVIVVTASNQNAVEAATIGIDNVHGFDSSNYLDTGSNFTSFRSAITSMGHTIVPLTNFGAADFAGLDAVILKMPYSQNSHPYSASDIAAVTAFANQKAVFVSDGSMWKNNGVGDRPISFGDNLNLLQNVIAYTASGHAAVFIADAGTGYIVGNMNALVANYGVSYASTETDDNGRTITGFAPHPITAGLCRSASILNCL